MKSTIASCILTALLSVALTFGILQSPGCQAKKVSIDPRPQISAVKATNQSVADSVKTRAEVIESNTNAIVKGVPSKLLPNISPAIDSTRVETAGLKTDSDKLRATLGQLDAANKLTGDLVKANDKQASQIQKLEDEKRSALQRLLTSLIVMSVLAVGVAAVLFASGNVKTATTLGIGAGATLITSIVVQAYLPYLIIGGGLLLIGGCAFAAYRFIEERRATKELVQTAEAAKLLMTAAPRRQLYGNGPIAGEADKIQSDSTKKLVAEVRKAMPKKLAPALPPEKPSVILN